MAWRQMHQECVLQEQELLRDGVRLLMPRAETAKESYIYIYTEREREGDSGGREGYGKTQIIEGGRKLMLDLFQIGSVVAVLSLLKHTSLNRTTLQTECSWHDGLGSQDLLPLLPLQACKSHTSSALHHIGHLL